MNSCDVNKNKQQDNDININSFQTLINDKIDIETQNRINQMIINGKNNLMSDEKL